MAKGGSTAARALQLLEIDPALGGVITIGFRTPAKGRRIPPHGAALTAYRSPWGEQPGLLDGGGRFLADLDILPPEAQAILAQRLDAGDCTLIASCTAPPWSALANRVAFLAPDLPSPDPNLPSPHIDVTMPRFGPSGSGRERLPLSLAQATEAIARAASQLQTEGNRAEWFALRAAQACARAAGRTRLTAEDVAEAIALVLAPRARAPLEQSSEHPQEPPADADQTPQDPPADADDAPQADTDQGSPENPVNSPVGEATQVSAPDDGQTAPPARTAPPVAVTTSALPPSSVTTRPSLHGAPIRSIPGHRRAGSLDLTATLLAAIPWQQERGKRLGQLPLAIRSQDLRWHLRRQRKGRLILFVVDGSGSMGSRRLGQAKGAVLSLLQQAYRLRDEVALIIAAGNAARLILPPTRALEHARRRLVRLPSSGRTPLAGALRMAHRLGLASRKRDEREPLLIVMTDGRANQPLWADADPASVRAELQRIGTAVRKSGIRSLLLGEVGAEAHALSQWLGATFQPIGRNVGRSLHESQLR